MFDLIFIKSLVQFAQYWAQDSHFSNRFYSIDVILRSIFKYFIRPWISGVSKLDRTKISRESLTITWKQLTKDQDSVLPKGERRAMVVRGG